MSFFARVAWLPRMATIACLLVSLLIGAQAHAEQNPFVHPGMYLDRADLTFVRGKVEAKAEPWYSAFNNLKSKVDAGYTPHVIPNVYEGNGSDPVLKPTVGAEEFCKDAQMAYDYALAWALTGNATYAATAIKILNTWSSTLKSIEGGNSELRVGWAAPHFCNAAELLKTFTPTGGNPSGWAASDITKFKAMLMNIFYAKIKGRLAQITGNNWVTVIQASVACIGVFCDNHTLFTDVTSHYVNSSGAGLLPNYIYTSGQCQESGRDQAHTQMGLAGLAACAEVAWKQSVDLYSPLNNRLLTGYEYTAKYNLGQPVPYQSSGVGNRWSVIGADGRSSFLTIWELTYRHYATRKGVAMPWTKQVLDQHRRPENFVGVGCIVLSRGTLTFYRGDAPSGPGTVTPVMTSQPANKAVIVGQTATFTVTASGTPAPTYQWQKNGANISGATAASYTTPATVSGDNGATYRCVAKNSAGSATSLSATLTVTAATSAPVITSQPANNSVVVGQTATFTTAASGKPAPAYQWQKNGANISGATAASYTTPATVIGDDGASFRCIATNSAGSTMSNAATLNVDPKPVVGTGTGLSGAYFANQDLTGTVALRTDAKVDFTWAATASPINGIAAGTFSVRWAGQVQAQYSQTYTFFATADDGVRLWVNGKLLVDQWQDQGTTEYSGTIALTAGTKYDIVVEYYQATGGARIALAWSNALTSKQLIPSSQLYPAGVSSPWVGQNLGSGTLAGSGYLTGDSAVLSGAGNDIWGTADSGRFMGQPLTGDGTIIARVVSLENTDPWAKAGVMIREGTAAGARHAFCCVTSSNGVAFQRRTVVNGASAHTAGSLSAAPRWLKLVRTGSTINGYESANGTTWTVVGTTTISLANPVQIGVAVTSHDPAQLCTAVFDLIQIIPSGNG
ncbi:MAG TPA: PA14 domain-containing protein [Planctomycetota bacterium]|nr:PA14 domain-containing protein [Planctomycetota bacterium]